jgi:hypothetical protein
MLAKLFRSEATRAQELRAEIERLGKFTNEISDLHLATSRARSLVAQLEENPPLAHLMPHQELDDAKQELQACLDRAEHYEHKHAGELAHAVECGREFAAEVQRNKVSDREAFIGAIRGRAGDAYAKACDALEVAAVELSAHAMAADMMEGNPNGKYIVGVPTVLRLPVPVNLPGFQDISAVRDLLLRIKARAEQLVASAEAW